MRRTKEDALETRNKLLESALDIMSENPYSAVSMSEIASRVGLSKGAVYWHFRNKECLLVALLEHIHAQLDDVFNTDRSSLETFDDLKAYYELKMLHIARGQRSMKIKRFMLRREEWPLRVREQAFFMLVKAKELERKAIEKMLVSSMEKGLIQSDMGPRELSMLISGVFLGIFMLMVKNVYEEDIHERHIGFIIEAMKKELQITGKESPCPCKPEGRCSN